ncbi:MAG: sel1 repeat family protein [Nitrospira sp.]|nr:sel1 repeat family protein [Nitrospira sp.]
MTVRQLLHAFIVFGALVSVEMRSSEAADQPQQIKAVCEKGTATACNALGLLYMKGEGVKQDDARAAALFKKACDGGDVGGCSNLGVMYAEGIGVLQDDAQAAAFSRIGCDGGSMKGCYNLGVMYAEGTGKAAASEEANRTLGRTLSL